MDSLRTQTQWQELWSDETTKYHEQLVQLDVVYSQQMDLLLKQKQSIKSML